MPSSDGFTSAERQQIDRAMRDAETVCRFEFSVYVGPTEGPAREYAERLHAALVAPDRTVLNLNVPNTAPDEVLGVRWATLAPFGSVRAAIAESTDA